MTKLLELAQQAEQKLDGAQLTWASTPKDVPVVPRHKALLHAVLGDRRQYAFANEEDREQFVYARNDTLFTNSGPLRKHLGMSPAKPRLGVSTALTTEKVAPQPKRNKFRK